MRALAPEHDALRSVFRDLFDRLEALEQGKATAGQASFRKKIRIGDAFFTVIDVGGGTLEVRAQNAVTGGPSVTIATLT